MKNLSIKNSSIKISSNKLDKKYKQWCKLKIMQIC